MILRDTPPPRQLVPRSAGGIVLRELWHRQARFLPCKMQQGRKPVAAPSSTETLPCAPFLRLAGQQLPRRLLSIPSHRLLAHVPPHLRSLGQTQAQEVARHLRTCPASSKLCTPGPPSRASQLRHPHTPAGAATGGCATLDGASPCVQPPQ